VECFPSFVWDQWTNLGWAEGGTAVRDKWWLWFWVCWAMLCIFNFFCFSFSNVIYYTWQNYLRSQMSQIPSTDGSTVRYTNGEGGYSTWQDIAFIISTENFCAQSLAVVTGIRLRTCKNVNSKSVRNTIEALCCHLCNTVIHTFNTFIVRVEQASAIYHSSCTQRFYWRSLTNPGGNAW